MAYFLGQATDYRDLLSKVVEFATSDNIASVAVNAGGSGYVVGDVLTISGGTSTTAAQVEVLAVSSGAVTEALVINAGAYSVLPGATGASTTGGTGTGCTLDLTTVSAQWSVLRQESQRFVVAVDSITDGGTGYTLGDTITLDSTSDGGTTAVTEATFEVTGVSGGVVTELTVLTAGEYTTTSTGVGIATTGGTGSGLEIDPLFTGTVAEDEVILEGSTTTPAIVGIRTFSVGGIGARNWELAAMTDFTSTLEFRNQPGISPGRWDASDDGCYTPLRDVSMNFWMSISDRLIKLFVQTGSNYQQAHLGFFDSYATDTEDPYPIFVMGTSSIPSVVATTSDIGLGGFPDPIAESEFDTAGPGVLRRANGFWQEIRNGFKNTSVSLQNDSSGIKVWPGPNIGSLNPPDADDWAASAVEIRFDNTIIERQVGAAPDYRIEPTPNTGGAIQPLFPITLLDFSQETINGEVGGLYWISTSQDGSSSASSNDTFKVGTRRFRVFQNVGRTEVYNFVCMEEV